MPKHTSPDNSSSDSIEENLYRLLFESSPVSLITTDKDANILEVNRWMLEEVGYTSDEIRSLKAYDLYVDPSDRDVLFSIVNKDRSVRDYEVRVKRKDGSSFVGLVNIDLIKKGDQVINLTSIRNITNQKEYVKVLVRDRRAFQIIADAALNSMSVVELCRLVLSGLVDALDFNIGTICLQTEKEDELETVAWTGVKEDIIHRRIHYNDKLLVAKAAREKQTIFAGDVKYLEDYDYFRERLKTLNINSFISWPITDSEENLVAVINLASNEISEIVEEDLGFFETVSGIFVAALAQKKAEEELRESQELFQMFTDHMPGPVFIKDHESRVLYINRFMRDLPMIEDWVGKTNYDLFPAEVAEKRTIDDKKVIKEGPREEVHTMRSLDDTPLTYRRLKFPIHREGKDPLIGGFSININEQVKAEDALREARARAEFFTDLMAHDLNNIHQGVMASLELLLSDDHLTIAGRS
ncbi:MAG: PAS domain S-box protein, partial [Candidatus Thorarchaeota archaeon]